MGQHGAGVALGWFEDAPGLVALLHGPHFVFSYANAAFRRTFGCDCPAGLSLAEALPGQAGQGLGYLLARVIAAAQPIVERNRTLRVAAGGQAAHATVCVDLLLQPIAGPGGEVGAVLVQGQDVSLAVTLGEELRRSLTHDALTGLPNYTLLRERLGQAIARARRGGGRLAAVALDLDRFKRVNTCLGHEAGDAILAEIAARLQDAAGPGATVARENGDKFLLLLETGAGDAAHGLAQALMAAVAAPLFWHGAELYVTCSVGVAQYPVDGENAEILLAAADRALLRARQASGTALHGAADISPSAEAERFHLGAALRRALAHDRLEVHYQPQLDLVSGKLCGVEALVRWNDPELGRVDPALLVGVAEECGLIETLGTWVLRTACAQAMQWVRMGCGALRVSVNLSARQFASAGLEETVACVLADTGLPPECLDLELTESLLVADHALACMNALRRHGVRFSVDDFGTGYSSLAYLRRFPIDVLKIDKSFLDNVPESDEASALVESIIAMGHSLGMRVIAEGVEREIQCDFLSRKMCDEVQGFFFSPALPADQLTRMLHERHTLPEHLLRLNRSKSTLLLVDDEPHVLSALKRQLRQEDYQILTAANGEQGLQVLARHPVDVIVSDQRMPGMTGVEFLRTVRQVYPDTVRIVLSGYTELQSVTDAVNAGAIYKFLTKPWECEQLREHIREAFSHRRMANENRLLTLEVQTANQRLATVNRQLEQVLASQRRQIERGESSLDIVREALDGVPFAVLAIGHCDTIVLANRAALNLFPGWQVLGAAAQELLPGLPAAPDRKPGLPYQTDLGGATHEAMVCPMDKDARSYGWLVILTSAAR